MVVFGGKSVDILDTGNSPGQTFFQGYNKGFWSNYGVSDFNPVYVVKFKDHVIGIGESEYHVQGLYDVKQIDLSPEALQKVEDDTVLEEV